MKPESYKIWDKFLTDKTRQIFFCKALLKTIESILEGKYTNFDALTRSNCCQGIAIMVTELIAKAIKLPLSPLYHSTLERLEDLENDIVSNDFSTWIPHEIIDLLSLYLLCLVRHVDEEHRVRTKDTKLREIAPLTKAGKKWIVNELQKYFSIRVAESLVEFGKDISPDTNILGAPFALWQKYVREDFLRIDERGVKYASCLFSLQTCIMKILHSKIKIVIVDDVLTSYLDPSMRIIKVLESQNSHIRVLSPSELTSLAPHENIEPVIVISGYAISDHQYSNFISTILEAKLPHLLSITLAACMDHPDFPAMNNDLTFDNSRIIPEEDQLKKILQTHSCIPGLTYEDPSLFRLSHIYPASLGEVIKALNEEVPSSLRQHFIGHHALKKVIQLDNAVA